MIDPIQSLAFSIQSNPGVYALLLGSGVSRSAQIPTGWEIVLDLLGKLAAATGENPETDLEQWYRDKYGDEPEYSSLLEALAKTQAERQQLLRPYFEPNEQEREEGLKQPTAAHRAIARLVSQGFVKVIVTTNFDRLIEKALDDEGVESTTLSTPEQVKGALPLVHAKCCVFKVHGDYQDPRIRNSESELSSYPDEYNSLLNQIFDEYGLLVCGWSAEWDGGLRDAILRAPSRRFTTYWALRGEAGSEAQRLIDQRCAQVIPIEDADGFLQSVQQTVESIEEFSKPHPLSTEAAVAGLKRYLSGSEHRIRLFDLIDSSAGRAAIQTTGTDYEPQNMPEPSRENVTARFRAYESVFSTVLSMASIGGFWAEDDHFPAWERALERLSTTPQAGGSSVWLGIRTYPAILVLYALGIGAVSSGRLRFLQRIFSIRISDTVIEGQSNSLLYSILIHDHTGSVEWKHFLEGMDRHYFPLNDWVHSVLREPLRRVVGDDERYSLMFDKLEILMSIAYARFEERYQYGYLRGAFLYRYGNRARILGEISESIANHGDGSIFVECGIIGEDRDECTRSLEQFREWADRVSTGLS